MENPAYLSEQELIELHDRIIGLIGGKSGIRDHAALESCVAQPKTTVFGVERFPTVFDKAAAYCFFIVSAHPFMDGNKRAGLVAALTFLLHHGVAPAFTEDEMYSTILQVARGELSVDDLSSVFRRTSNVRDPGGEDIPRTQS
ncbi:MAG: type II toxin-antitoxin system death-on-curing family toxin [Planctomycetes bacterium]|nr:type II toxin-antitoxin system death-on-curing family toxin [Planctomycetota bacterium]